MKISKGLLFGLLATAVAGITSGCALISGVGSKDIADVYGPMPVEEMYTVYGPGPVDDEDAASSDIG